MSETKKNKRKRSFRWCLAFVPLLVLLLLVFYSAYSLDRLFAIIEYTEFNDRHIEVLEEVVGVSLPQDAVPVCLTYPCGFGGEGTIVWTVQVSSHEEIASVLRKNGYRLFDYDDYSGYPPITFPDSYESVGIFYKRSGLLIVVRFSKDEEGKLYVEFGIHKSEMELWQTAKNNGEF